jgi:hypothetical protein
MPDALDLSVSRREQGLASTAIPMLELHAGEVFCSYLSSYVAGGPGIHAPAKKADLPAGFRTLWLCTSSIMLSNPYFENYNDDIARCEDAAHKLCCFPSRAPKSYYEFRLSGSGKSHGFSIE